MYTTTVNSPCGMKCCFPGCLSKRRNKTSLTPRSYFSFPKDSSRCASWVEKCNCGFLMYIDPVVLNRKYRLCSLHFEDKMFSNYQKNRLKPKAIPTIFENLAEEVPIVGQFQTPSNNIVKSENTVSCSMSITNSSAVNTSVTTSDASSEIKVSTMSVQTHKHLSANTPRKLRLHERLVEEIRLRKELEDREQDLLDKVNSLSLQLAERYSIDYTLKVCQENLKPTLFMLVKSQMNNLQFLMTSRLNQDNIERFFSMMNSSCGSNNHPDSVQFMQIFRLISTYCLVKPPKGSNISGGEILSSLFSKYDLNTPDNKRLQFQQSIDCIVENGCDDPDMSFLNVQIEHNYATPIIGNIAVTSDPVLAYISGYVARKASSFTKCPNCLDSLTTSQTLSRDILIEGISHGHLRKPSTNLFNLIKSLESATLKVMVTEELSSDTIFKVVDTFGEVGSAQLVGCSNMQHKHGLTSAIINFFLVTGMHFICSRNNSIENSKKEKTRLHQKSAKLI